MRYTVPVENLLLLLRSNAIVLVKEVKERTFRLLQRGIGTGFQVAQVRENALLEFLRVFHGPAEGLESKGETSYNIGSGNVKEIVPVQLSAGEAGGLDCGKQRRAVSFFTYHSTQDTYSPVGNKNLRIY